MSDNTLTLKTIGSLLQEQFYIPAYQRGYRWKEQQVTDLLDDIKEYYLNSRNNTDESFYCLQPIVVKQKDDKTWEVVDGQQRLTTIYIILTCLSESNNEKNISRYHISYETRGDSAQFLKNIKPTQHENNIDFFHIYKAKKAVESWFKSQEEIDKYESIQTPLLNLNNKSVKVIWYELGDFEKSTEVFSRLNIGKIPLVNAELVKALFLKASNFYLPSTSDDKNLHHLQNLKQLTISQEWDSIEKSFQDDAFWYFLNNDDLESNRIELLLNLYATSLDNTGIEDSDKLKIFLLFNNLFNANEVNVAQEWLNIKRLFMTLEEWFNDRELFHLIGFLITEGIKINSIITISQKSQDKRDFRKKLISEIFELSFDHKSYTTLSNEETQQRINHHLSSELTYDTKSLKELRRILLLFNIVSLLSNSKSNSRFQFDRFKRESWDVEHIRSVTSDMPDNINSQKSWLKDVKDYLKHSQIDAKDVTDNNNETSSINNDISQILQAKTFNQKSFENIYKHIIKLYDPNDEEIVDNSIGNLTLLDSHTNRSYKNSIFPIKRKHIIELDKKAIYVPLCTKNVFLKYYSTDIDKMLYWNSNDRDDHQEAMINTMTEFFTKSGAQ